MPSAPGWEGWPGTAITSRPSSSAARAVERAPLRAPASTTTVARAQPAMTRLRLAEGWTASEALRHMVAMDGEADQRQALMVDATGRADAFTGRQCYDWAGHHVGDGYACAGNILVSGETVEAMARGFEATPGRLAERLVAALAAGQAAGGDRRGQQAAAVLVVRTAGGYMGRTDRYVDLRVDDHPTPIAELQRLLGLHHLYSQSAPEDLAPLTEPVARELLTILRRAGVQEAGSRQQIAGTGSRWQRAARGVAWMTAHGGRCRPCTT